MRTGCPICPRIGRIPACPSAPPGRLLGQRLPVELPSSFYPPDSVKPYRSRCAIVPAPLEGTGTTVGLLFPAQPPRRYIDLSTTTPNSSCFLASSLLMS